MTVKKLPQQPQVILEPLTTSAAGSDLQKWQIAHVSNFILSVLSQTKCYLLLFLDENQEMPVNWFHK